MGCLTIHNQRSSKLMKKITYLLILLVGLVSACAGNATTEAEKSFTATSDCVLGTATIGNCKVN